MTGFQLTASPNPLFATTATQSLSTTVKYEAPQPISLWRRVNAGTWTQENLIDTATSAQEAAELEKRGKRTTPGLTAGKFVEYGVLTENIDPNGPGFSMGRFQAHLLIDVLLTPTTLVAANPDDGLVPGGTYVRKQVHTSVKTRLRFTVGREPAMTLPNGFPFLPNALTEAISGTAQLLHAVEAGPLVAGTPHFALTLLIAESGEWQAIKENFKTKRRKVTVQFKKFKVLNDGDEDPWGEGDEVKISFRVYNGEDMVNEFTWGPGQISTGSEVGLNLPDAVVGPDDFNGLDPGVSLGIYAVERDYFFWIPSTDEAEFNVSGRKRKPFFFPVGSGSENVNPQTTETNFDITATPMNGDGELSLRANVRHVVAYE
jgi:hypothetical protein